MTDLSDQILALINTITQNNVKNTGPQVVHGGWYVSSIHTPMLSLLSYVFLQCGYYIYSNELITCWMFPEHFNFVHSLPAFWSHALINFKFNNTPTSIDQAWRKPWPIIFMTMFLFLVLIVSYQLFKCVTQSSLK